LCALCFQKGKTAAVVANATLLKRESLLADLNFHSVSGLYKHFTRMSAAEFECLIHLTGNRISKKDRTFRKAISVQQRLALKLRFFGKGQFVR
jgi:hypothetical protein